MKLNNFDTATFLSDYWQKRPLVIRKAFNEPFWLEPDELAGLACEEETESRIITNEESAWTVACGPFAESKFSELPEKNWTLLVQAVDQWVPEVKDILTAFSFLPRWRLDDIMVSFAPTGGTVSQHYDYYDVFLIQGEGSRSWQVGDICGSHSELIAGSAIRILKDFAATMEVVLYPGDMLYIPAKYAHLGVSLEDSLTYSVGFRAASIRDLVDGTATAALEYLLEDDRYEDSAESLDAPRGEIPQSAINKLKKMLTTALNDDNAILSWFGQFVTEKKYPDLELMPGSYDGLRERLAAGERLDKNPSSRFAYSRLNGCTLFVDGCRYAVSLALAEQLANYENIDSREILGLIAESENLAAVEKLLASGALIFSEEDEFYPE